MSICSKLCSSALDANPHAMRLRRETVEHPFGTIFTIFYHSIGTLYRGPQGKDLLVHLGSDSLAALVFVAMLSIMYAVAAFGATALIAAWLYPRLAFDRQHPYWFYWPELPQGITPLNDVETEDVIVSSRPPILVAIGLPVLVITPFTLLEWRLKPILLFAIAAGLFTVVIWKVVPWAAGRVLRLVAWSHIPRLHRISTKCEVPCCLLYCRSPGDKRK